MRFRWIGWDAVAAPGEGTSRLLIFARGMRSVDKESEGEWPGCPSLRASNEHSFTVHVLQARRAPGRSLPILRRPRVARAQETV